MRVTHETRYSYPGDSALAYNRGWLAPIRDEHQSPLEHAVDILPEPGFQCWQGDAFGNASLYFEIHTPHSELSVTSVASVERHPRPQNESCRWPWEYHQYTQLKDTDERSWLCPFAFPSARAPHRPAIADYVRKSFSDGRPLAEALEDLSARIYSDFTYESGSTQVDTPLDDFWAAGKGVCQDYAHLAVSGLRSLGLMAAYVSGYVMTASAGETPLQGADASHAWVAVYVSGYGWLHIDPTNNLWVRDEHLTLALGRDYSDIPPLKGLGFGTGRQPPEVAVTLERLS